jgi:hypothetical protein
MLSCGRPVLLFLAYVFFKPYGLQLASCWAWKVPEMPIGSHLAPNELSRRAPPHLIHLLRAPHILAASQTISSDGCRSFPIIRRHKTAHTNRCLQTMMLSDGAAMPLTTIRVQIGSAPTVAPMGAALSQSSAVIPAICIHTNRCLQTMMLSDGAAMPLTTIRVQIGSAPTVASNWIGTNRRLSPVRMMIGGSVVEL